MDGILVKYFPVYCTKCRIIVANLHRQDSCMCIIYIVYIFRSKYDELKSALLTVKYLGPALVSQWNACRQGPHSLGKHYPLFYARLESFLNGNRPRQQSLFTLLDSQAFNLPGMYQNSTTLVLFTVSNKRHWYPSNNK